jgi:hypothetical protein
MRGLGFVVQWGPESYGQREYSRRELTIEATIRL